MGSFLQVLENDISQFFTAPLFELAGRTISLLWILSLIAALIFVGVATRVFGRFLKYRLLARLGIAIGNREAIATLGSYTIAALGCLLVLDASGLNLSSLSLLAGGLGVGIGLGLQDFAKNLLSGVALLVEGKLQAGDYIEVDDRVSGYIKEISGRATVVRTIDGIDAIVPNNDLANNRVLNWSYLNLRGRLRLTVEVDYRADPLVVTEVLLESAYMEEAVLRDPTPLVLFKGFGNEAFKFELLVWVERIDLGEFVESSLYYIIEQNLRAQAIALPSSTKLDVHMGRLSTPATVPLPTPTSGLIALLKQCKYFQECSDLQMRQWLTLGYRWDVPASHLICREGEPNQALYIILTGTVESFLAQGQQPYNVFHAGNFFGELALFLDLPILVSAKALEDTTLFVISKSNFYNLLRQRPSCAHLLLQDLEQSQELIETKKRRLREMGVATGIKDEQSLVNWVQTRLREMLKF
ncbi:MAG: mechanosensitive ion channel [Aphanocapsa sp. GSE-SYN-MK-11-07L]|jgi:small-conductance mechanosensitive channel|nr:mechanosensitive ion channel [Aphanocapsa sp. GSE-SYN-MK-11-07L]